MDVKPVKHYSDPTFPTRWVLDEHPEILRLVPKRWQTNTVVLSALAGMYLLMAGSKSVDAKNTKVPAKPRVAPIFQHGDGRGAFGCEAINPPVFLSEAEAREVIVEEAKRVGLVFQSDGPKISNVVRVYPSNYNPRNKNQALPAFSPIVMDGQDRSKSISYEFVSEKDLWGWEIPPLCTAYKHDSKAVAHTITKQLSNVAPKGSYAVFYEPFVRVPQVLNARGHIDWEASRNKRNAEGKVLSRQQLRKQVQDFIKWLKAEGVI